MKRIDDTLKAMAGPGAPTDRPRPSEASQCPICKGAGWVMEDVPYGHPSFGRAFKCDCLIAQEEERKFAELLRLSELDPFREKGFANFDPSVKGDEKALQKAHEYASDFGKDTEQLVCSVAKACQRAKEYARDPQGWLMLWGRYGCGKTHLAAAIANYAVDQNTKVLFTVVPDLLQHLRSTFAPQSEVQYDELFEAVKMTPLLILDDLGTEYDTPWTGEKLYQLLNHRYNYELPTVITSNRRLRDLDSRIASRINDRALCCIVIIAAGNYREKQPGERRRFGKGRIT